MPRKSGATTKLMAKKKGAMNRVAGSTNSTKESPIPPSKTTRKMAQQNQHSRKRTVFKEKESLYALLTILSFKDFKSLHNLSD